MRGSLPRNYKRKNRASVPSLDEEMPSTRLCSASFVMLLVIPTLTCGQEGKNTALIVGKWEALADKDKVSLEFTKTGTLHVSGNPRSLADVLRCARILYELNAKPEIMPLTYKPL